MAIGIGSSWLEDDDDAIGPFAHWLEEAEDMAQPLTRYGVLYAAEKLPKEDIKWLIQQLKKLNNAKN